MLSKVYFARAPFETRIHSSLVKSGLLINYNVRECFACVVFPDVSPINLSDSYESCRFESIRAVLRTNPLDLCLKPKLVTDCD